MKAVVTGASSGIGKQFCLKLAQMGYDIYAVARRKDRLEELGKEITTGFVPVVMDLSGEDNCKRLYEILKDEKIDVFINNAGFGVYGKFLDTSLERELEMIDLNIRSVHILTKLFAKKFLSDKSGFILNVASSAGYMMGPFLSSYYASKAYVLRLTEAVDEEIRRQCRNVSVSVLCPGPVKTEFDKVADVSSSFGGLSAEYVAKYGLKKMFAGKRVIVPGISMKVMIAFSKLVPGKILSKITYNIQKKKGKINE